MDAVHTVWLQEGVTKAGRAGECGRVMDCWTKSGPRRMLPFGRAVMFRAGQGTVRLGNRAPTGWTKTYPVGQNCAKVEGIGQGALRC